MIKFEWDMVKAQANLAKHGVSFQEAQTVFYDDLALQFFDPSHSQLKEDRFLLLGMSQHARLLLVCHCEREQGHCIRIISASKATKTEQRYYRV